MSSGKKRERENTISSEIRVSSYTETPSVVIGSFYNGFTTSSDTDFKVYKNKKNELLLHGENSRLEFNGSVSDAKQNKYALAVFDPVTKSVQLYNTPVLLGSVESKAHKKLKGPKVKQANIKNVTQRNNLGEAFGTRRAKKAIESLERNRIDSEKLKGVETDIVDTLKNTTEALPTREQLTEKVLNDRPTPECFADATDVTEIYPINYVIPKREYQFIRVSGIITEKDLSKKLEQLPYKSSPYIKSKLLEFADETQTEKVQLLYYASLLMGVYHNRRISNKTALITQLNNPSEILIDGILERFTVNRGGQFGRSKARNYNIDPHHEDKLLCYLLVTILHINNFLIEVTPLAQELSLKQQRLVGLLKALGCGVKPVSSSEAAVYGIPKSVASSYKIATLKVPFKLPQMTRRGRRV